MKYLRREEARGSEELRLKGPERGGKAGGEEESGKLR